LILGYNGRPSFKGYRPAGSARAYPASLCISLNHEVVHAVPDDRMLKQGDIVSLDLGVYYGGFHTDGATTIGIGKISDEAKRLIFVTQGALDMAVGRIKAGVDWGSIAHEIKEYAESAGFSVVRDLTGHGIGRALQEDPHLPNFGRSGEGPRLAEGMVIAVEPMVAAGRPEVEMGLDGFVYQTKDKSLAAHFEHTVAVTKDGVSVLTRM
ncbi:MAG: type I methionyl aminopeptidase, partial [Parcubacteria group bacterium]|nr:type I methionyl aminopeptidase [Parcubacteria group bacterium]